MKIQSASLDVPGSCPNQCEFCVSELSDSSNMLNNVFKNGNYKYASNLERQFEERLEYLRDIGINTLVLTGTASEPHLNKKYLELFHKTNQSMKNSFKNIELQTSGIALDESKFKFLGKIGVKTISLSISSFDSALNNEINVILPKFTINIPEVCCAIKNHGFNLRLSLNINKIGFSPKTSFENIFNAAKNLEADQVTFRRLYTTNKPSTQNVWVKLNRMPARWWRRLEDYIHYNGRLLHILEFGASKYSINGMSVVVDYDCMNKNNREAIKYIILRRNCKLYSEWDDPASLIF